MTFSLLLLAALLLSSFKLEFEACSGQYGYEH
jgi:hypothetical protein